jgi:8-oxo-dGTP pyrophosphatase MutT (NUDIX family)
MTKIYFTNKSIVISEAPFEKTGLPEGDVYMIDTDAKERIDEAVEKLKDHEVIVLAGNEEKIIKKFEKRFSLIKAAGGFVYDKNNILFIFRKGKWDLPKGKLDKGESLETCAVREVEEETGLKNVIFKKPLTVTYHTYSEKGKEILKETHWFLLHADSSMPLDPQTMEDIEECKWTGFDDLEDFMANTYPLVKEVVSKGIAELSR